MIKQGRRSRDGAQPADLLVCFPSHRNLIPNKPICSPGHPTDITKLPHRRSHHHLRGGHAMSSPHLWVKTKPSMMSQIKEPTSPKVSCAGNIKVIRQPKSITNTATTTPRATTTMTTTKGKYRSSSGKNWHSDMEEIEMTRKKNVALKKMSTRATTNTRATSWMGITLGKKKDVMKFLKNLRNFRLNFGCLGSFEDVSHQDVRSSSSTTTTSLDEEDEVVIQEDNKRYEFCHSRHSTGNIRNGENSYRTNVMSKMFIALQENKNVGHVINTNAMIDGEKIDGDETRGDIRYGFGDGEDAEELCAPAVPPPNALLLMRCKTLPAKSWLEERDQNQQEEEMMKKQRLIMKWENQNQNTTDIDSCKISSSNIIVNKNTWVIDAIKNQFSRSRSWKI